jgi:hypothetical protein
MEAGNSNPVGDADISTGGAIRGALDANARAATAHAGVSPDGARDSAEAALKLAQALATLRSAGLA